MSQNIRREAMAAFHHKFHQFTMSRFVRSISAAALLAAAVCATPMRADDFTKPSSEELKMTSLPGYPGAPAVVLNYEQITQDDLHVQHFYVRIKILTEDGKKYANVELPFVNGPADDYGNSVDNDMDSINGRTIHADGTIIPFTGKPYLKTIEKEQGIKVQERVFTLPDVEVGSIIEYHFSKRYNDMFYEAPQWIIQRELFIKSAHFVWYPTQRELTDGETGSPVNAISWFPILPKGVQIEHHDLPQRDAIGNTMQIYELHIKDVPPTEEEKFMPPISSFSYRVLFNFTPFTSYADFWKSRGKSWSKHANSFIGPSSELRTATQEIIAGSSTDDQKLHKIYSAVMALDNTDFSREHERQEDKAAGLGKVNNAGDVLTHKRGNGVQLTELFIGMARAAGFKAYLMVVTSRTGSIFASGWQNFDQLDSILAIVNVGGKDVYFDPGSRYCPYGRLVWGDTNATGIRQTDDGTAFGNTPGEVYTANSLGRAANLTIDDHGTVSGKIDLSIVGADALLWRQRALRGDEDSIRHAFRTYMEDNLPKTMQVKVGTIENLDNYEQPLHVQYVVSGNLGSVIGKRLVLPVEIFHTQSTATFPNVKRTQAIYFHFPRFTQDAIRVNFPPGMTIEGSPAASRFMFLKEGLYLMNVTPAANNITIRRTYVFNDILVPLEEYPDLRNFYSQFEAKDQESIVLKQTATASAPSAATPPAGN
jgi:hypothetical protein